MEAFTGMWTLYTDSITRLKPIGIKSYWFLKLGEPSIEEAFNTGSAVYRMVVLQLAF